MDAQKFLEEWGNLKKDLKEQWNEMSDLDIDIISGKKDELVSHIEKRYGISREQAEKEVDEWLKEFESTSDDEKKK